MYLVYAAEQGSAGVRAGLVSCAGLGWAANDEVVSCV